MNRIPHLAGPQIDAALNWSGVTNALVDGHALGPAEIDDTVLRRGDDTLLSRSAWIDGLGVAVKTATIFPANSAAGTPVVNGSVALFSDTTGELDATLDFHLLTKWKTAADSLLAATRLARRESRRILIVGSGTVAASMVDAYRSAFPDATIAIWSRTLSNAEHLAERTANEVAPALEAAVVSADIVSTATMTTDPLISGDWLTNGQHLDLIGGYRPDMREADDRCVERATVFVDSRTSAFDVGDIAQPIATSVMDAADIVADFSDLASGSFRRDGDDQITMFKNAGGAHLDLMVARHILASTR